MSRIFSSSWLKLYANWTAAQHFSFLPGPGNNHSTFCFYAFYYFSCLMQVESCIICPSVTSFSHFAWCPPSLSILLHKAEFPTFLRLNNIPVWYVCVFICTHYIFFIYAFIDGKLDCFHFFTTVNHAAVNMGVQISLQFCFQFF